MALLSLAGTTSTAPAAGREPVVQDVRSFLQISRLASCINKTEPGSRLSYSHPDSDNFIREILTSRPLPAPRSALDRKINRFVPIQTGPRLYGSCGSRATFSNDSVKSLSCLRNYFYLRFANQPACRKALISFIAARIKVRDPSCL